MDVNFDDIITTIQIDEAIKSKMAEIWLTDVFVLSAADEDHYWQDNLNLALGKFRKLVDDTHNGAVLFGQSAAWVYYLNSEGCSTAMDIAMTKFKDRFQNVDADARQAFNDGVGLSGKPNN